MVRHQQMAMQQQKQTTITAQESLQVVRSLLRVSVFHVSYLRGLFDEQSFKAVNMDNLEGMSVKMLTPHTPETKRLVDWVEQGVYDALKNNYLKTLIYGMSTDSEGTSLLEEYKFSFDYGDSGAVTMNLSAPNQKKKTTANVPLNVGYDSVKFQVVRLMRMLVQICQTLDVVPSERYLFMKMVYHDETPDDYQPPCFKAADPKVVAHFTRKPFTMDVGTVNTNHHHVGLKVLSTLDECEGQDAEELEKSVGMQNSTLPCAPAPSDSDLTQPAHDNDNMECDTVNNGATSSQDEKVAAVKAFCLKRKQVDITGLMAEFVDVSAAALTDVIIPRLKDEGLLVEQPGQQDMCEMYRVTAGGEAAAHPKQMPSTKESDNSSTVQGEQAPASPQPAAYATVAAAQQMQDLSVHPGEEYVPTQAVQHTSQPRRQKRAASGSMDVQGHNPTIDNRGAEPEKTECTTAVSQQPAASGGVASRRSRMSRMKASSMCAPTAVVPEPSQPPPEVFFTSQQSTLANCRVGGRRQKLSINEATIRQSKRARTASRS